MRTRVVLLVVACFVAIGRIEAAEVTASGPHWDCRGCKNFAQIAREHGWPSARVQILAALAEYPRMRRFEGVSGLIDLWQGGTISFKDMEAVYLEYRRTNDDSFWRDLRAAIAITMMDSMDRAQRMNLYVQAVDRGSIDIFDGFTLDRYEALLRASMEGVEELRGGLEKYGPALEKHLGVGLGPGGHRSLLWRMKLRAGATDAANAELLEGRRLVSMGLAEIRVLIDSDEPFAEELVSFGTGQCSVERASYEGCREFARLLRGGRAIAERSNPPPAAVRRSDRVLGLIRSCAADRLGKGALVAEEK